MQFPFLEKMLKQRGELHHGYALIGDRAENRVQLFRFLEQSLSFPTVGNPDFHLFESDALLIEDARAIREVAIRRSIGGRGVFLISFGKTTEEAEQALLKTLEEPIAGTHFFLLVQNT